MKAIYYGDTNIGYIRPKNEDAFVLKEVWEGSHLLAVAVDGVGANGGGDVAANLACKCITDYFNGLDISTNGLESLMGAVRFANNTICSEHYIPYLSQMSCVLTAALLNLETGRLDVCHVGDTRLYMLKDYVLTKVTSDHSIVTDKRVEKLIDAALEAGGKDNVTVIVIDLMK